MKIQIRKLFRYPAVDGYLFFSFVIAFTALFVALSLFNSVWNYEDDCESLQYMSTYSCTLLKSEELELDKLAQDWKCSLLATDISVELSFSGKTVSSVCELYFRTDEMIYPLVSGSYPESLRDDQPVCVIGREIAKLSGADVGDTVVLDGENYKVTGILGTEGSDYLDGKLLLWYPAIAENTAEHLRLFDSMELLFASNTRDTYECYKSFYDSIKDSDGVISVTGTGAYTDSDFGKSSTEAYFYILLYSFSILHCVIASDLWIYKRKYELSVKKVLGYTNGLLILDIFLQILRLVTAAAVFCLAVQWLAGKAGKRILGIELTFSLKNLGLIALFVLITSAFSILRPVRLLDRENAVSGLKNRSDGI